MVKFEVIFHTNCQDAIEVVPQENVTKVDEWPAVEAICNETWISRDLVALVVKLIGEKHGWKEAKRQRY